MTNVKRIVDVVMVSLFAFATIVQFNDPDPVRWVTIYAAACLVSVAALVRWRMSPYLPLTVAIVALTWGLVIALSGPGAFEYTRMFDAWEMKSIRVEEAREASGLLLVAGWMTVLWLRAR